MFSYFLFFSFTSCAAGLLTCLVVMVALSWPLASTATGGRRELPLILLVLRLLLTSSPSMRRRSTRRTARISAGTVSPSAALVLY